MEHLNKEKDIEVEPSKLKQRIFSRISRRDLFSFLLGTTATYIIGKLTNLLGKYGIDTPEEPYAISPDRFQLQDETVYNDDRQYTDGETILSEIGSMKVNGWKIYINSENIKQYFQQNPDNSLKVYIYALGIPGQLDRTMQKVYLNNKDDSKNEFELNIPPSQSMEYCLEIKSYNSNNNNTSIQLYKILPKYYKSELKGVDIISPVPLTAKLTTMVEKVWNPFKEILASPPHTLYMCPSSDDEGASYALELNTVSCDIKKMSNLDEMERSLYHELSHALFWKLSLHLNRSDQNNAKNVFQSYKNIMNYNGWSLDDLDQEFDDFINFKTFTIEHIKEFETESLIRIFDESSYVHSTKDFFDLKKHDPMGHPYENYNEFFASAMTVLRYFSDQFLENYKGLKDEEKHLVKPTVQVIFDIIRYKNKKTKKGEPVCELIIPAFKKIQADLQIH